MHAIINRIRFGNFRFLVELEAGDETEPGQITLWVEEKIDVSELPLSEFTLEQLLYAVREPLRGRLHTQLEAQRERFRQGHSGKNEVSSERKRGKGRVKNTVGDLKQQQEQMLLQFEHNFRQNQLLALDRTVYNLEILQAESHIFGETRFLYRFKDGEIDDDTLRQRCFQFAFDPEKRAQMLDEAGKQPQPVRQIFG